MRTKHHVWNAISRASDNLRPDLCDRSESELLAVGAKMCADDQLQVTVRNRGNAALHQRAVNVLDIRMVAGVEVLVHRYQWRTRYNRHALSLRPPAAHA